MGAGWVCRRGGAAGTRVGGRQDSGPSRSRSRSRSRGGRRVRTRAQYNEAASGSGVSAPGVGRAVEKAPVEKAWAGSGWTTQCPGYARGPVAVGAAGRARVGLLRAPPCCHGPGVDRDAHPRRPRKSPFFPWGRVGRFGLNPGKKCPPARPPSLPSAGSRLQARVSATAKENRSHGN